MDQKAVVSVGQRGWPRTTLVKRIEYLRTRLSNAGGPNLFGENALPHLAEWALATGVLPATTCSCFRRAEGGLVE